MQGLWGFTIVAYGQDMGSVGLSDPCGNWAFPVLIMRPFPLHFAGCLGPPFPHLQKGRVVSPCPAHSAWCWG